MFLEICLKFMDKNAAISPELHYSRATEDDYIHYITILVAPSVDVSISMMVTKEGNNISLKCNVSGKPEPSISWTRIGSLDVLSVSPSLTIVNVSRPGTADNMIQYQCTASNGVETPATATVNVTVECKWKLQ